MKEDQEPVIIEPPGLGKAMPPVGLMAHQNHRICLVGFDHLGSVVPLIRKELPLVTITTQDLLPDHPDPETKYILAGECENDSLKDKEDLDRILSLPQPGPRKRNAKLDSLALQLAALGWPLLWPLPMNHLGELKTPKVLSANDLYAIEAARLKRERKAAKKVSQSA